jgi:sulfotransferase family protein
MELQRTKPALAGLCLPVRKPAAGAIHARFRELPPPIIVIGMHRSGTSLAAGMLAMLGVYMGPDLVIPTAGGPDSVELYRSGYAESEDFRRVNDLLLQRACATWCDVDPYLERVQDPRFAPKAARLLRRATFGSLRRSYLRGLRRRQPLSWGWKDPRNSLTLRFWLELFPEARIIHVRRDPEAVAASLHRRAINWAAGPPPPPLSPLQRVRWWLAHPGETLLRAGRKAGILAIPPAEPDPCLDRDYCRTLADRYVRHCLEARTGAQHCLEVWYEDLVEAPEQGARRLAAGAGLSGDLDISQAARLVARASSP